MISWKHSILALSIAAASVLAVPFFHGGQAAQACAAAIRQANLLGAGFRQPLRQNA